MGTHDFFKDAPFSQEQIDLMTSVFEQVIRELGLAQGSETSRSLVANAIFECAGRDIFDPFEMRKCAHEVLIDNGLQ